MDSGKSKHSEEAPEFKSWNGDEENITTTSEPDGLSAALSLIQNSGLKEEESSESKHETDELTDEDEEEEEQEEEEEEEFEESFSVDGNSFTCDTCQKVFTRKDAFSKHVRTHFENFSCELCGKTFNRKDSYRRHIKKHEETKNICHVCGKDFESADEKYLHLKEDHGIKRSELYSPEFKINAVKRMKEIGVVAASKELHIWESTLSDWQRLVFNPLHCTYCGKTFTRENSLKIHVELVHLEDHSSGHQCDKCSKLFPSSSNLKRHLINCQGFIEKKELTTICHICHKTFSRREGLLEHIRFVHEKERNYVCEYCTKAFARKNELSYHVSALHEKSGEHACGFCEKRYPRECELIIHERTHTGEKPYICDCCGKAFSRKNSLQRHSQLHGDKPYMCSNCGESFTSYKARRIQLKCEKCQTPLTPVSPQVAKAAPSLEPPQPEPRTEMTKKDGSDSLIRNRQGTELDLRKLYMDKFSSETDAGTLDLQNNTPSCVAPTKDIEEEDLQELLKFEMKAGSADEMDENEVKEEPLEEDEDGDEEMSIENDRDEKTSPGVKRKLKEEESTATTSQDSKEFDGKDLVDESFFVQSMEEVNQCNVCGKIFTSRKSLTKHIRRVHRKDKTYFCHICTKTYGRKEHLTRHIEDIHTNLEKLHKCDKCEASFKTKAQLTVHVRFVHDKEKNFVCDVCTKTFGRKTDLTRHITDVHEQSGNYGCEFCAKRFFKMVDKKRHEMVHTGEKPYQCENCGQRFKGQSSVKKHSLTCGDPKRRQRKPKEPKPPEEAKEYPSPVPHTEFGGSGFHQQPGQYQPQHAYNIPFPGFPFNSWK